MQRGPGAENAFGGVAQGFADNVPFLVLPGGHDRTRFGVHPGFDSVSHYGGITKWSGYISDATRIPEMFRSAFTQMKHGRPAPTLIETPSDVATGEYPGELDYRPVKVHRSGADPDTVSEVVTELLRASAPMMYVGQGVHYAEAYEELVEFAELTHIPVMTTLAGKSAFPENHALALGTGANSGTLMVHHYLQRTDYVLGVGASFTNTHFNAPVPQNVPLAQITNAVEDINKDHEIDHGLIGDAKLVLRQMIEEVKRQTGENGRGDVNGVIEEVATVRAEFMKEWGPHLTSDELPISPYRVLTELKKVVDPDNSIVTHDSGYPREQFVPFWPSNTPHSYIGWGKSTQLGYGPGAGPGRQAGHAGEAGHQRDGRRRLRYGGTGHRDGDEGGDRPDDGRPEQRRDDSLRQSHAVLKQEVRHQRIRRRVRQGCGGTRRARGGGRDAGPARAGLQTSGGGQRERASGAGRGDYEGRGDGGALLPVVGASVYTTQSA